MAEWKARKRRRGMARQRRPRQCERRTRRAAVALTRWCRLRGRSRKETAARLGISASTLRRWERSWRQDRMGLRPRGRPPSRVSRELRFEILTTLQLLGPETGLPTLRRQYADVPRAELQELQRHSRRLFRRRKQWLVHVLHWTRPGAVWAMDFADPPLPIDGMYPKLFCLRDLASGKQLMALPCPDKSARSALTALRALARWCELPLVLKCDNEKTFCSREIKQWAHRNQVLLLFSPPGTPEYNGSIEAGIGSIKPRAHYAAARQGRPGEWTCDDVEAAVQQANTTARPHGLHGPTPAELWADRLPFDDQEREDFRRTYRRHYGIECHTRGIPWGVQLQHGERASIDRVAISRALIEHGFLLVRRKRVSLPNSHRRACKIS